MNEEEEEYLAKEIRQSVGSMARKAATRSSHMGLEGSIISSSASSPSMDLLMKKLSWVDFLPLKRSTLGTDLKSEIRG